MIVELKIFPCHPSVIHRDNKLFVFWTVFVMLLTVPWFYEKHEDQVDIYAQKAKKELKRQYSHLDEKVLQKLPKVPFVKDSKQQ